MCMFVNGETRTRWSRSSPASGSVMLVLLEVMVVVVVVKGRDESHDFTPPCDSSALQKVPSG